MNEDLERFSSSLVSWYDSTCREFLVSTSQERATALDAVFDRLRRHQAQAEPELPVCFLGSSGVGKSTLLNGLVAGDISVLPQGGIGPLTAQATVVRFAQKRFFKATYQTARKLNNLLFALEKHYEAMQRREGREVVAVAGPEVSDDDRLEVETALPKSEGDNDRLRSYCDQVKQLIRGDQYAKLEIPYLAEALRACLEQKPRWNLEMAAEDLERIAEVRRIIGKGKKGNSETTRAAADDLPGFLLALQDHASGFLAPLIKTLEVGWDADFLAGGLVLVDLPGVGVANDEYREVTQHWIRHAKAVALVVDRAGVTEASADLLRTTGFLNGLLHEAGNEDGDVPTLLVVGVKLDETARDARNDEKQQNPGQKPRKWIVHFEEACGKFDELIRGQLHQQLQQLVDAGGDDTRAERQAAIERVLQTLEVHPVSAYDLRLFLEDDEDDRPRIRSAEESRIPGLQASLHEVVSRREQRAYMRGIEVCREAYESSTAAVDVVLAQWGQQERAADEAARLKADLEKFIGPLQSEFQVRQGAFREFLRGSIPMQIETRVDTAGASAQLEIQKYLRSLKGYHWATLRAAVRHGGTYDGAKNVDLPNEMTLRFEEPVAVVWSKYILAALRKETKLMSENYVRLVGEVVEWTRGEGTRVQPKIVEAMHAELKAQTKNLGSVGKEAINELKEAVKAELCGSIEKKVRKKCQQFVQKQLDVGTGVKDRMHEFFEEELSAVVVQVARPVAIKILTKHYQEVQLEIEGVLKKYRNPLDTAQEAIVGSHEQFVKRSDAQKRKSILERGRSVAASVPKLPQGVVRAFEVGE